MGSRRVVFAVLVLAGRTAAAAEAGGPGPGEGGARVEVAAWWAAAGSLDTDYAFVDPSRSLSGGGEVQSLSYDRRGTVRLRAGWRFAGGPVVSATLFEHEAAGRAATGMRPGQVGALLASPDFAIGRSLVDSASSESRVRATEIGVDLAWEVAAGRQGKLEVAAGIAVFRFERATAVTYEAADFSGQDLLEIVNVSTDARGIGPRVAAAFAYPASGRAGFFASAGLGLFVGDLEATATDSAFVDGAFDRATVVSRPGTRRTFPAFDGAVGVRGRVAGALSAFLEYRLSYRSHVARGQRFVDDVSQNTTLAAEESLSLEGLALGLAYEF